ncbi:MAG TPA: glycosyl hydrolase 108 family protein [Xanthobacteraceae bacterium]|nr:glycosyl hydrolase 108 family protein [Xanthobacteraceae bacterium]
MTTRFDLCLPFVLAQEQNVVGQWSNPKNFDNDPHDPGGKTWNGIIQREYDIYRKHLGLPTQDVREMTEVEGSQIYLTFFWQPYCDRLRPGLDLQLFDAAVNEGTTESIRILQVALGVKNDGKWGPITAAVAANTDLIAAIKAFTARRHEVYKETKGDQYFDKDWQRRTDEIGTEALKMAESGTPVQPPKIVYTQAPKTGAPSMTTTITLPTPSVSGIAGALAGSKTYIGLAIGAAVVIANHFGFLPTAIAVPGLNPNNWLSDLWYLYLGAAGRSALNTTVGGIIGALFPASPAVATPAPTPPAS